MNSARAWVPAALVLVTGVMILAGCGSEVTTMDQRSLEAFAGRYAAAWSGGDPAAFAGFYAEDATFRVNDGEVHRGRAAIAAVAGSYMEAFPDMKVALVRVVATVGGADFHWRWTGTNTGPGGNGRAVDLTGCEEWTFAAEGLITSMPGHFDQAEYDRQMGAGAEASPPPAQEHPTIELPPELARVLTDYERAWRARDAAALAALFAEDGWVLSSGRPPVRGRAAITRRYRDSGGPLALRALAWSTEGTLGVIIGAFARQEGEPDLGKFTLTLRRGPDGRWLILSDMDNGNRR